MSVLALKAKIPSHFKRLPRAYLNRRRPVALRKKNDKRAGPIEIGTAGPAHDYFHFTFNDGQPGRPKILPRAKYEIKALD